MAQLAPNNINKNNVSNQTFKHFIENFNLSTLGIKSAITFSSKIKPLQKSTMISENLRLATIFLILIYNFVTTIAFALLFIMYYSLLLRYIHMDLISINSYNAPNTIKLVESVSCTTKKETFSRRSWATTCYNFLFSR